MRVSVCIPHYRQEEYLMRAVQSALEQVSPGDDVEVVVSDNASGGDAQHVLDQLEAIGPPVKVLRNTYNIGMVANFNRAVSASSGEVVCLLSADDELLPGAVRTVCDEYRADPELVLVYGRIQIEEDDRPLITWPPDPFLRERFQAPRFALHNLEQPDTPLVSAFFRRKAFDTVGGFKGEAGSVPDWLLWTELGLVGPVLRTDQVLGLYRVHGRNETLSAKKSYHWILSHYMAESYGRSMASSVCRGLACRELTDLPETYAKRSSMGTVMSSLRRGQRGLARKQLILTYSLWPSSRAFGELVGGTVLSFLPRTVIEMVYRYLKSRRTPERVAQS